jgi:NitT/TauT family transport system permease protein
MKSSDTETGQAATDNVVAPTGARFDMAELKPPMSQTRYFIKRVDVPVQAARLAIVGLVLVLWWSKAIFHGVPINIFGFRPFPKINDLFVAGPGAVWHFLTGVWTDSLFWKDLWVTVVEAVIGFALGASLGLICGLLMGRYRRLAKVFDPFLVFTNATPKIALAPILILWYGIDIGSKIALATIIVFFVVQIPTTAAIGSIDPDLLAVADTMAATERQKFTKVIIPGILGPVFGALRLAAVISMLTVVFGEFIASKRGLGQRLLTASNQFNMGAAFGLIIVLALLALMLNALIGLLERRLLRWQATGQSGQVISL